MTKIVSLVKRFFGITVVLLVATITLTGCFVKPIYNVENRVFTTEAKLPMGTIKQKIKHIAADRGWMFEDVAPGHMIGKIGDLKHSAKIDLHYTQTSFSITYLSSHNLKKDGQTIHFRYNRWIEFLERDLVVKLGLFSQS